MQVGVVRRVSGGGAVYLAPGAQVWVDLYLPAGDPLLLADVRASFGWLGAAFKDALERLGSLDVAVQGPAAGATEWGRLICFAALGAGEVTVGGRKVVGMSQRRDRHGAWFHSMVPLRDTTAELADCLALDGLERDRALRFLRSFAGRVEADPDDLVEALLSALP